MIQQYQTQIIPQIKNTVMIKQQYQDNNFISLVNKLEKEYA